MTGQGASPSDRTIVLTRVFDAPRRLVFEAVTQPAWLKRWLSGPPGWSLAVSESDLRVGGRIRFEWHGPEGKVMGLLAEATGRRGEAGAARTG